MREVREVDLHAVAEASGELVVDGDGGHLGEKGAGVRKEGLKFVGSGGLELGDGEGVGEVEGAGESSAERGEMGTATGKLAELVGDRADVTSGRDGHGECGGVAVEGGELEVVDGDAGRFDGDFGPGAGEPVGGGAVDFLGGEDGGS